mmetsp:Transcript_1835/g.6510  ORF Transcript_1835/g.6510 Transcript_1835/m.6510 type:complete len:98 (-) Transcript_1835:585-878(-)
MGEMRVVDRLARVLHPPQHHKGARCAQNSIYSRPWVISLVQFVVAGSRGVCLRVVSFAKVGGIINTIPLQSSASAPQQHPFLAGFDGWFGRINPSTP